MSQDNNTALLEKAHDMIEEFASHPSGSDKALRQAVEDNDLDEVRRLTSLMEATLAQQEFEANDAY